MKNYNHFLFNCIQFWNPWRFNSIFGLTRSRSAVITVVDCLNKSSKWWKAFRNSSKGKINTLLALMHCELFACVCSAERVFIRVKSCLFRVHHQHGWLGWFIPVPNHQNCRTAKGHHLVLFLRLWKVSSSDSLLPSVETRWIFQWWIFPNACFLLAVFESSHTEFYLRVHDFLTFERRRSLSNIDRSLVFLLLLVSHKHTTRQLAQSAVWV